MMNNKDFCVFIITHGRHDVITFETLKSKITQVRLIL